MLLLGLWPADSKADTWDLPHDSTNHSENGQFQFFVAIGSAQSHNEARGTLSRKSSDNWEGVWTNRLVNQVSPASVCMADSGRYVVTFDEHGAVGQNPVVIYGEDGRLIANLTLSDLKLLNYSKISRSVSSYWWDEYAVIIFGPTTKSDGEPWERTLEDSLFIRLHWGEVIQIDLASGKVRDTAWWESLPPASATALKGAVNTYLDSTWQRLAREYFRKENFYPDPTYLGMTGLLLVRQLHLHDALPLLKEIAATERFQSWHAPPLKDRQPSNVHELALAAIAEIE